MGQEVLSFREAAGSIFRGSTIHKNEPSFRSTFCDCWELRAELWKIEADKLFDLFNDRGMAGSLH